MSRIYKMMHDAALHESRKLAYSKKVRELRNVDRTKDSPLMRAPDASKWRVAMTEPRREQAAMAALNSAGWRVWYPQETIVREIAAKRERATINVPLFARYVFVAGEGSHPIGDCRHVTTLLPYVMPRKRIIELEHRQFGGEFKSDAPLPFTVGQRVTAELGWISALDGIVRHANHERVRILTTLFGSEREIEASINRVKAA